MWVRKKDDIMANDYDFAATLMRILSEKYPTKESVNRAKIRRDCKKNPDKILEEVFVGKYFMILPAQY